MFTRHKAARAEYETQTGKTVGTAEYATAIALYLVARSLYLAVKLALYLTVWPVWKLIVVPAYKAVRLAYWKQIAKGYAASGYTFEEFLHHTKCPL